MMFIRAVTSALFLPLNTVLIISGLQAFLTLAVPSYNKHKFKHFITTKISFYNLN